MARVRWELRTQVIVVAVAAVACAFGLLIVRPPRPRLAAASLYNFGTVPNHTQGRVIWRLKNEGSSALMIRRGASIGCSSCLDLGNDEILAIPADGQGTVAVLWNTRSWTGPLRFGERLVTNDPANPTFDLMLEGVVAPREPATTTPPSAEMP